MGIHNPENSMNLEAQVSGKFSAAEAIEHFHPIDLKAGQLNLKETLSVLDTPETN